MKDENRMKSESIRELKSFRRRVKRVEVDKCKRKHLEQTLRASEERFRKIFEESQIGMITSAPDYRFEKVNLAFYRMIGYTTNELTSMTFAGITHLDDIGKDIENIKKLGFGVISFYGQHPNYCCHFICNGRL